MSRDGQTIIGNFVFLRLVIVQFLNMVGDGLLAAGVPILLLSTEGSAAQLSAYLVSFSVGALTTLVFASIFSDRHSRRQMMIYADLARIAAAASIALSVSGNTGFLIAGGLLGGIGTSLFRPMYGAYIADIVPPDLRRAANGLRSLSSRLSGVLGPGSAAVLFLFAPPLIAPAIVTLFSVLSIVVLFVSPAGSGGASENRSVAQLFDGFREVLRRPWMTALILQGAVQIGLVAAPITLIVPIWLQSNGNASRYGLLLAVEAIGAILGTYFATRVPEKTNKYIALPSLLLQAGCLVTIAAHLPFWAMLVSYAVMGFGLSLFGVIWVSSIQAEIPAEKLGRVLAIDALGNTAMVPVGLTITGIAVALTSLHATAVVCTVILVVSVVGVLGIRGTISVGVRVR